MQTEHRLFAPTIFLLFATLLVMAMLAGGQLLIPFVWAFLFSYVMMPFAILLEKKVSRSVAAIIATLVFVIVSGLVLFFLIYEAIRIMRNEPVLFEKIRSAVDQLQMHFESIMGVKLVDTANAHNTEGLRGIVNWFAKQIVGIGENVVTLTLIPMYLFFILNYRGLLTAFVEKRYSGERKRDMELFFTRAEFSIQNYLLGTLILTGVSTVMSFLILFAFGINYAFFFAVFIALLNLIPYIGNLTAFVVVLMFVWITKDTGSAVLFVGLSLWLSNIIQENFLRPKLIGDKMEMNAMMVFTAVVVGGMIWGFSGMVLFIPLLGILQALLNSSPEWRPYAVFFEAGGKKTIEEIKDHEETT
ncbi:AI-2E family transporter [Chryseolinea sp. T2]|uniref:AI-2E family transporter n=1 Tax=Chryseolinea sp. T2 TaxID=3129255 RepID=UPI003076A4A2